MGESSSKKNKIQDLIQTVKGESKKAKDKPGKIGHLPFASANKWIEIGKTLLDPIFFFFKMIVQFEINIIFSAAGTGKSILLTQIAESIARTMRILVIDCELSTKQFQMRYSDKETGATHIFPENFLRAEINPDLLEDISLEDAIFDSVKQAAEDGIKIIGIDNLTFIITDAEKAEATIKFMRRLIRLKKKYGLTLIIVAHTPKRDPSKPLTRDDLSGSSKLMALIDDAIAVGLSARDKNERYVKTIKFRDDEDPYPADSVAVYKIEKVDGYTQFVYQGRGVEKDFLRQKNNTTDLEDMQEFVNLQAQGMTLVKMAEETGFKKSTIHRKLKKALEMGIKPTVTSAPSTTEEISHPNEEKDQMGQVGNPSRLPFKDEEDE